MDQINWEPIYEHLPLHDNGRKGGIYFPQWREVAGAPRYTTDSVLADNLSYQDQLCRN